VFENYYAVIMAGGGGTRLWPVSRQARPKQMVSLFDDRTLFQISVDRLAGIFPPERICVVTVAEQAGLLAAQCPQIPAENYFLEPAPRGTASVVGLAAVVLQRRDPQAVMAILTADHYIGDVPRFHQLLRAAFEAAGQERLVTLGIAPTFASTGYGYIQIGEALGVHHGMPVHRALRFKEKPAEAAAAQMIQAGDHAWNSGMFVWKTDAVLQEFARQMPELYAGLQRIQADWDTPGRAATTSQVWQDLKPQTIDYGIMEGARNVAVIPAAGLQWSDVGSWESLFEVLPADADGNIVRGSQHLPIDTRRTLVFGEGSPRLVVTIGVEDLVIVEMGDVLMVCARQHAQQVRQAVQALRQSGPQYL
jgi:mannose-1-phosphate guanylyltransferase